MMMMMMLLLKVLKSLLERVKDEIEA